MHESIATSERELLGADRIGNRMLGLALEAISCRSLRQFVDTLAGDPPLRQVLISRHGGRYHSSVMQQAATAATRHPRLRKHELDAVYAATLIARVPDMISAYAAEHCPAPVGSALEAPLVAHLARRCDFFTHAALRRLRISDPVQAAVVFDALGWTEPARLNDLHSDRLASIVRESWRSAEADHLASRLPNSQAMACDGSNFTTL